MAPKCHPLMADCFAQPTVTRYPELANRLASTKKTGYSYRLSRKSDNWILKTEERISVLIDQEKIIKKKKKKKKKKDEQTKTKEKLRQLLGTSSYCHGFSYIS